MRRACRFLAALAGIAILSFAIGAIAAEVPPVATSAPPATADVVVPWGAWVSQVLQWVWLSFGAALTALIFGYANRYVPDFARQYFTQQVVNRAVSYAFAVVEGAATGKSVTLPQSLSLINAAEQYVLQHSPGWAKELGDALRPRIIAELSRAYTLSAETSAATLLPNAAIPRPLAA